MTPSYDTDTAENGGVPPAAHHDTFGAALAVPCSTHQAKPGQPCYPVPRGVCGARQSRGLKARLAGAQAKRAGR